ncbi:MAG: hypothetical protein ACKVT0_00755 [Planctomycetaceae bacterium]
MAKKPPKKETTKPSLQTQTNFYDVLQTLIVAIFQVASSSIWPGAICICAYFIYLSISALSGKTTDANIVAQITAEWGLDRIVLAITTCGGVGYGMYERKLRMRAVANVRQHSEKLEMASDPARSGSGLLPGGEMPG